jgi:hypothetical protein
MSTDGAAAVARTFRVGRRTCTITIPRPTPGFACCLSVEWAPDIPAQLSSRELAEYRAGRDGAIALLAQQFDTRAVVIEL